MPSDSQLSESELFSEPDETHLAAFDKSMSQINDSYKLENENIASTSTPAPDNVEDLDIDLSIIDESTTPLLQGLYNNPSERHKPISSPGKKELELPSARPSRLTEYGVPTSTDGPVIIACAYSTDLQKGIVKRRLSWGVQYELARLISAGRIKYEALTDNILKSLAGPSSKGAEVPERLLGPHKKHFYKSSKESNPWAELDREEGALKESPFGGIGFDTYGHQTDYGGKVEFSGQVRLIDGKLYIKLRTIILGPSSRFKRRFGSTSFLDLKFTQEVQRKAMAALQKLVARPFVIFGTIFRAFYVKDRTISLFRTNEAYDGSTVLTLPRSPNMSLGEFINWINPFELNSSQPLPRFVSHIAWGLSTSVPGLLLRAADISIEPDLISPEGSDLTDGCGYINKHALITLFHRFKWPAFATAIEVCVRGEKGTLLLHPTNTSDWPRIWLRPSQTKIHYPNPLDPSNLIIDVLRPSHLKTPAILHPGAIINLGENGVPSKYFFKLFRDDLNECITNLTEWDGPEAMFKLWNTVADYGNILSLRKARDRVGEAHAKGFPDHKSNFPEEDQVDDDGDTLVSRSLLWWMDETSGCPASLSETAMDLISGGFTPDNCWFLREKLKHILETTIKYRCTEYYYPVPMSCSGLIVPDPYGVLEPDEIQVRSSQSDLITPDGLGSNVILGDILLTRHPCTLPTDIRKFKAVDRPELRHYEGVIVCSVRGPRRQVEIVDGNYGGDVAEIYWDPSLVEPFKNAPMIAHVSIDDRFSSSAENVSEFLARTATLGIDAKVEAIHDTFFDTLHDGSLVGIYNILHDYAVYTFGYTDPRTMYLGCMKKEVLNRRIHGEKVVQDILIEDKKILKNFGTPKWRNKHLNGNEIRPRRSRDLPRFIMDRLYDQVKKEKDIQLVKVEKLFESLPRVPLNNNLTKPWLEEWRKAQEEANKEAACRASLASLEGYILETVSEALQHPLLEKIIPEVYQEGDGSRRLAHLKAIKEHVEALRARFRGNMGSEIGKKEMNQANSFGARQNKFRILSKKFASIPSFSKSPYSEAELSRLCASYAFLHDTQIYRSQFPWVMALRELTDIQCQALGSSKTVTGQFNDHLFIKIW